MKTWKLGYEKAKQKAKEVYARIGRVPCDALDGEYVAFTGTGFTHIMRKGRVPRTRNEQKRRFVLVPRIEQILKNPKATIVYRKEERKVIVDRHGEKTLMTTTAEFWTFTETVDDCSIKVVIRQLSTGGPKHFFSVMGDSVKIDNSNNRKNKKPRR